MVKEGFRMKDISYPDISYPDNFYPDNLYLNQFYKELKEIKNIQIIIAEPLRDHTTFRIGGPADYFVNTSDATVIKEIIGLCKKNNIAYFILGNGSDLLFADEGYRGVVIKIAERENNIEFVEKDNKVYVTGAAGILLSKFAMAIAEKSLTGFEFAAGIPGSLGGAIYMNAGAYDGEMKDTIISATVLTEDGEIISLSKEELELSYRSSIIQRKNYIVLDATFAFEYGNKTEIIEKINDLNQRRRDKQPLEYPSAGSTFKRPEGYFAGKLIMDSGLRGYRVGDAMVSEKHCGFVINAGNATAEDVKQLVQDVTRIVKEKFGVTLEPEIRIIDSNS